MGEAPRNLRGRAGVLLPAPVPNLGPASPAGRMTSKTEGSRARPPWVSKLVREGARPGSFFTGAEEGRVAWGRKGSADSDEYGGGGLGIAGEAAQVDRMPRDIRAHFHMPIPKPSKQ